MCLLIKIETKLLRYSKQRRNSTIMLSNKYLELVLFNIYVFAMGIEVNLSAKDNITWLGSNIKQTATSIKDITNDIFFALKLKKSKSNERIKQYAITYNYFSSITSKEDENLQQISIASRVDNTIGNVSRDLVDVINEVLNEEPGNNTEESKHEDIQVYVDHFLKNLEYLKNSNGVNSINYDVDNQILQLMRSDDHDNDTKEDPVIDDDYDESSDNEFWRPGDNTRRIYKGENTKVRYFPFMASVHIFNNFQCGGSIIKSDLIITAASCLQLAYNNRFFRENPSFLSVRIGSNYYVGGGETIAVLEVYFYPTYDPKSLNNNIAIMRLDRRIKFRQRQSRVKKIEFDRNAHRLPMSGIQDGVTIIGWGAKSVSNVIRDPWNNRLSFAVLDVYPLRECQEIYSKEYVTQKTFCAGFMSKGGGACSGDVGGPGIVAGVLAGIISFGSPRCGTPDAPTVFTKVGYYADWIDEIMEQDVPTNNRKTTTTLPPTPYTEPLKKSTKFIIQPIYDKDFFPVAVNKVLRHPLRAAKKKPNKSHPKKDDPEMEDDNLFKEFLAVMFGSNEVKDYEKVLDDGKETQRNQVKKILKMKKITSPTANELDLETTVSHDWNDNDDEEHKNKATRSYQTTSIVDDFDEYTRKEDDDNEVPLIDDQDMVGGDITDYGHTQQKDNLNVGDNLKNDGDIMEDDILKLIESLDITSEKEIDKLVAQISDEPYSQETVEINKNPEKSTKKNMLKSFQKDKVIDSEVIDTKYESVDNEEIFDDDNLDDGVSVNTGYEDLALREKKNDSKKDDVDEVDSLLSFLPKEDMYQLLAEAVDEITRPEVHELQNN